MFYYVLLALFGGALVAFVVASALIALGGSG